MQSDYLISGIYGDVSKIEDNDAQEVFATLELSEINASMEGHATWTMADGRLSMPQSFISVENIGRLNIGIDLLGYTLAMIEKGQEMNKIAANADPDQAEMMAMQMLMGMAADLSFGSFSVRFDDDSLTNKMLDFIGQEEGMSRKGIISTVAEVLPAMLAEFEIPELEAEITDAVVSFLMDPQSLEIKASPAEAVPLMAIMAVAQNPSLAQSMLNVRVIANQPE